MTLSPTATVAAAPRRGVVLEAIRRAMPHLRVRPDRSVPLNKLVVDSLDTVELLCVLNGELGVSFAPEEFAALRTVGDLEDLVLERMRRRARP
jgi:acyl carrier protein